MAIYCLLVLQSAMPSSGSFPNCPCWKSGSRCERARCTARVFPFLGFFHFVLTSLHSRYVCSIPIVFIHYIGSLVCCSMLSVCLTSSPRPNNSIIVRHPASFISTQTDHAQLVPGGIQEYPSSVEVHSHLVDSPPLSCPPLPQYLSTRGFQKKDTRPGVGFFFNEAPGPTN